MRSPIVAVLVVLLLAFAGCVDDTVEPEDDGTTSDSSASGTDPSSSPPTGTTPSGPPTAPGAATAVVTYPEPTVETISGNIGVKALLPFGPPLSAAGENDRFPIRFEGEVTGHILILEWSSATPLTQEMELWVHSASAIGGDFRASGTSPVRLAMATADAAEPGYVVDVLPGGATRAGVQQTFTITKITFDGAPFDAEWIPPA